MIFVSVLFGIGALVMVVLAFSNVAKGKIGTAIAFFIAALVAGGMAGAAQVV